MENLNFVSLDQVKLYRAGGSGQSSTGGAVDAFAQIIQNMVDGMNEETKLNVGSKTGQRSEISNEQFAAAGMALLEAMNGQGLFSQMMLPEQAAQAVENLIQEIGTDTGRTTQSAAQVLLSYLQQQQGEENTAEQPMMQILSALYREGQPGERAEQPQEGLLQMARQESFVRVVKNEIANNSGRAGQNEEEAAAQAQSDLANAQRYENVAELRLERAPAEQPVNVTQQITQQLSEHLELGEREFTMTLKPESLGELTIQLVSKDNKTTLSIVTSTKEAADLVNRELAALRQAVSPMEVEVRPAVQEQQQAAAIENPYLRNDDQSRQNRGGQQRREEHRRSEPQSESFVETIEELFAGQSAQAMQLI